MPPRAAAVSRGPRARAQPAPEPRRASRRRVRRAAHPVSGRHYQLQGARRPSLPTPPRRPRSRPTHGAHHRRGPEPGARGARGGAPAHQPRDDPGEAPAGDPDRPAGAGRDPRPAEAPPAGPAGHGAIPPRAALAGRRRARTSAIAWPWPAAAAPCSPARPCGCCIGGLAAFPVSSTPSRTGPCWAPIRGSARRSTARPSGARRRRCWASRRAPGDGGDAEPRRRRSSRLAGVWASCSWRRRSSGGARLGARASGGLFRTVRGTRIRSEGSCFHDDGCGAGRTAGTPPLHLADVLLTRRLPTTKGDALDVLRGLWGRDAAGTRPDCDGSPSGAFECVAAIGTWQKLRRLDVPAVLELADPEGQPRYGVLTSLTPSGATLRFGDRVVTASLAEVEPFWDGAFVVLLATAARDAPAPARSSRACCRLAPPAVCPDRRLPRDRSSGASPTTTPCGSASWPSSKPDRFEPDGVVGRETAILLQRAEWGPDVPRLSTGAR